MPPVLLDTNVLVHAAYKGSSLHGAAARLLDQGLRESGRFCIAPQNIIEFCSVVTRSRFVEPPLSSDDTARMAKILYQSRRLSKIYPKRGTVSRAVQAGNDLGLTGPAWYDLFLAITMQDAGIHAIVTENIQDFRRFPHIVCKRIEDAV